MSLIWDVLVGLLWAFDHFFNQIGTTLPVPGKLALGVASAAAGLFSVWRLGGRDIKSATNSMILICVITTPVLLLGAGEPLLAWALCLAVCASAMWVGNAENFKSRWLARSVWVISFLAPALLLDNGPSAALILSLFAWTAGWSMRRMPLHQKSWLLPKAEATSPNTMQPQPATSEPDTTC